jgi:hypothetical protein
MADTQILAALRQVRSARKQAMALLQQGLAADEQATVQQAYDALDDLEETLVDTQLEEHLAELKQDAQALEPIITKMKAGSAQLQTIATVVSTAAQAVGALASIVGQALEHGLL